MPELVPPTPDVRASFLAAMVEFQAEGRGSPDDLSMVGDEIRQYAAKWADPERFAEYVRMLRDDAREEATRPPGYVPCTNLWWISGPEYLGRLAIRHRLTPSLLEVGGHIGYDVRPTARRRGHATAMLAAALPVAYRLGIERVLITCNVENVGSRRVIEANGGVLEDVRGDKRRYWVAVGPG
jgi:predicted acetyltransferase